MSICDLCQLSSPSGCTKLSNEVCLKDALKLIKASATNKDVLRAVFPSLDNSATCDNGVVHIFKPFDKMADIATSTDWLYRAYREGDTEESDTEFMCKAMSKTINKSTDDRNFIGGF